MPPEEAGQSGRVAIFARQHAGCHDYTQYLPRSVLRCREGAENSAIRGERRRGRGGGKEEREWCLPLKYFRGGNVLVCRTSMEGYMRAGMGCGSCGSSLAVSGGSEEGAFDRIHGVYTATSGSCQ